MLFMNLWCYLSIEKLEARMQVLGEIILRVIRADEERRNALTTG
jgi:hypothetical protein